MRHHLYAMLAALAAASSAYADDPTAPTPPAEPDHPEPAPATAAGEVIVITGLRLPRAAQDVPAATTVIDRDDVRRSPDTLVDDLVRSAPSVGTFRRSSSVNADPTSQGLNLRGVGPSGVSRALVLRDGIPLNDPFGGWVYWRALSPLGIERIEIVPSGASALFGNFALGGVLQVISRPIDGAALDAMLAGGSLGTLRGAARATERFGDLAVAIDGEAFHSDGYTPITAAQRGAVDGPASSDHTSAGARLEYRRGRMTGHADARLFVESLDAGTQHTTADVRTVSYGAGGRLAAGAGVLDVELFGGQQRFEQERARVAADRATAATASRQRTPSNNQGAAVTWSHELSEHHTIVLGGDAQRVAGTATDALSPPSVMPGTLVRRAAGGEQRFAGVFAQDAIRPLPELEIAAALRLDGWQNVAASTTLTRGDGSQNTTPFADASKLQLDPRLGALYRVTHELAIRGSAYRAFRAPTLNELYRPFQVGSVLTAANDRLRPETLWGGELGAQLVLDRVTAQATAFWNRLSEPIANVTLAQPLDGATRQRQNLGASRIVGADVELTLRPADAWTVRASHSFSSAHVTSAPSQPDLVGKRLAQDPHHRTTAALTYDSARYVTLVAQVRYLGPQFEDDLNTLPIGAVVLVDAHAERSLGHGLTIFASGQNLFDRRYLVGRAGIDTEGAPRTFELGIAYRAAAGAR